MMKQIKRKLSWEIFTLFGKVSIANSINFRVLNAKFFFPLELLLFLKSFAKKKSEIKNKNHIEKCLDKIWEENFATTLESFLRSMTSVHHFTFCRNLKTRVWLRGALKIAKVYCALKIHRMSVYIQFFPHFSWNEKLSKKKKFRIFRCSSSVVGERYDCIQSCWITRENKFVDSEKSNN